MIITGFLFSLLFTSCNPNNTDSDNFQIGYSFSQPEKKFKLPAKLNEISGLSAISNEKVACIQDEEGKIYIYSLNDENIVETIDFGKKGDYEGITIMNEDAFVLRSDGNIFQIKSWRYENKETVELKTSLTEANDTEGICYDSKGDRLLIACKGKSAEGNAFKGNKAIYSFDLASVTLIEQPAFLISLQQIKDSLKNRVTDNTYEHLAEFLGEQEGSATFQPSGIAIHPFNGNIFIISSAGKLLVVLTRDGKILHIEPLDKLFKQPEGITFLPNGDMLISNEGRDGTANILLFKYLKQ